MVYLLITADTGSGTKSQYQVAGAMVSMVAMVAKLGYQVEACLLLGDNIYEEGVLSIDDPQFKTKFEDPYKNLDKPFYLLLGNHDYGNGHFEDYDKRHLFQVEYSQKSDKWNMPAPYYQKSFGPCDFFFLDTNFGCMDKESIGKQLEDIKEMIRSSKQKYKILCGHHTWRSIGGHGNAGKRFEAFMQDLLEDVTVDMYMCGHDHCKNHSVVTLPNQKKVHNVVIGTGGKVYDESMVFMENLDIGDFDLEFHSPNLGYIVFDATKKGITLEFYNEDNVLEYDFLIKDT